MLSRGSRFYCLLSGHLASPFLTQLSHNFGSKGTGMFIFRALFHLGCAWESPGEKLQSDA